MAQSLCNGISTDFDTFIAKFTEVKSVRYEHFLNIWKDMRMALIFAGRQNDQECREFTEDCLKLALTYCSSAYQFQVRVCGLYLLYAFYFKHPYQPKVKIRVMMPEWQELKGFVNTLHEQKHLDAVYVFMRLRYDRAFHFVATKTELHPGMRDQVSEVSDVQQQKLEMLMDQKSIISELFDPDTIDHLAAIHEEYHRVKCALAGPDAAKPQPSLSVIDSALVQILTRTVTGHEDWRKAKVGKKLGHSDRHHETASGHTTSESEHESDLEPESSGGPSHGAIRAEIKARAYKSCVTGGRRSRRRTDAHVTINDTVPSASSTPQELGASIDMVLQMSSSSSLSQLKNETMSDPDGGEGGRATSKTRGKPGRKKRAPAGSSNSSQKLDSGKKSRCKSPKKPSSDTVPAKRTRRIRQHRELYDN